MDLNKDRLRTAYDEVVAKIDAKRNGLLSGTRRGRRKATECHASFARVASQRNCMVR
jgi:hypothetical protein